MARKWADIKPNEQFNAGSKRLVKVNALEYVDLDNPLLGETPINPLIESQIDAVDPGKDAEYITDPSTRTQRRVPSTKKDAPAPKNEIDTSAKILPPDLGVTVPKPQASKPTPAKKVPAPKPAPKKPAVVSKASVISNLKKELAAEKAILRVTQQNVAKLERQLAKLQTK